MIPRRVPPRRCLAGIPAHLVAQLTRVDLWRAVRDLVPDAVIIIVVAWLAQTVPDPLTYPLAVILIGVRLHA